MKSKFTGALNNIQLFDLSRCYPEIVIIFNLKQNNKEKVLLT